MTILKILDRLVSYFRQLLSFAWVEYLPPAMIYFAAGVSGLTAIVGTFFVKEYLGLSAMFLAGLGFWAGIPWALKMPLGHLVDVFWRRRAVFVVGGALCISLHLAIMVGLIGHTAFMRQFLSIETWYVIAAMLAPVGYVLQDVVADALSVHAVPTVDSSGQPLDDSDIKKAHQTSQTIARSSVLSGSILVAVLNVVVFRDIGQMGGTELVGAYLLVYKLAFFIPVVSVSGLVLAWAIRRWRSAGSEPGGVTVEAASSPPDWTLLGGSSLYVALVLTMGLLPFPLKQEVVFLLSFAIVLFLMLRVSRSFSLAQRRVFFSVAAVIFIFRAMPGPGPGVSWWEIDVLGFDQGFFARLMLLANFISMFGVGAYALFFSRRRILFVYGFLAVVGLIMSLPFVGMYYGLHEWTAEVTNGLVNARTIALFDTALESPLGQVAMIPLLAWTAWSSPPHLKATFFAVVTSFINLGGSASALGTKYLNGYFVVSRQVIDPVSGAVLESANYAELGPLLVVCTVIGFLIPMVSILVASRVIGEDTSV